MLRIDRSAIERLPPAEREEARALLEQWEAEVKLNPLIGYEPHPKQRAFHASHCSLKAFLGGNRSGKTTAGILDDLIQAVDRDVIPEHLLPYKRWEPPFYCRIVVPDFKRTLEGVVFQKLYEWAPKNQLVGGGFSKAYEKSRGVLRFKNGSWFDFLTFEQDRDKFGGAALHRVHFDEEPPREIRQESMMRLIDYGGDELFTMTPFSGMSWLFEEVYQPWTKGLLLDSLVITVDMDDNPHLSEPAKRRALAGLSQEELQARKSGKFVHFAGMIYDEFDPFVHVIPQAQIPADASVIVGIDPGMRHMAAVVWCYLTPQDQMVVFDEVGLQGHTVAQVANAIHLTNAKHGREGVPLQPDYYVIDPSARNVMHQTGRSDQMEFIDHGIISVPGQNSVTAGINRVKERLQNKRLLVMANCQELISEFKKYRWASATRSEHDSKEMPVKRDDHLLDALRYVIASRPTLPDAEELERFMTPMERAIHEDMKPKRKKIPQTDFGGVFA